MPPDEFIQDCPEGCPGCCCHIAPPCGHCVEHFITIEQAQERQRIAEEEYGINMREANE